MYTLPTCPTIPAAGANIIRDFGDDMVAVLHDNGFVGIYCRDEGELFQIGNLAKSTTLTPEEIANNLWGKP